MNHSLSNAHIVQCTSCGTLALPPIQGAVVYLLPATLIALLCWTLYVIRKRRREGNTLRHLFGTAVGNVLSHLDAKTAALSPVERANAHVRYIKRVRRIVLMGGLIFCLLCGLFVPVVWIIPAFFGLRWVWGVWVASEEKIQEIEDQVHVHVGNVGQFCRICGHKIS